ncbi:hypothetical protein AAE478_005682 [Parahypoxylon ruwenzoriense]
MTCHHTNREVHSEAPDYEGPVNRALGPDPEPKPDPGPGPHLPCWDGGCKADKHNLHAMFPGLKVRPRPEPDAGMKDDYDAWKKEYDQWGPLRCPCNRGYFCRVHGSWISGEEVGSGKAPIGEEQHDGSCPKYHYGGNEPQEHHKGDNTLLTTWQTTLM